MHEMTAADRIWRPSDTVPAASRNLRLFALHGTGDLGRDVSEQRSVHVSGPGGRRPQAGPGAVAI